MGRAGGSPRSSSGEEDGDANWRAAIDSVASFDSRTAVSSGPTKPPPASADSTQDDPDEQEKKNQHPALKLYQIKAQKILDDFLGKSLEIVRNPIPHSGYESQLNGDGVRLFGKAPPGVTLDPVDAHLQPRKRPRILPGEEIDEKSKKFKRQVRSVAIDGASIVAAASDACQRSLEKFEAKDAAAKAAARREDERVAELKKVRGEKWLPSIAKETQGRT